MHNMGPVTRSKVKNIKGLPEFNKFNSIEIQYIHVYAWDDVMHGLFVSSQAKRVCVREFLM